MSLHLPTSPSCSSTLLTQMLRLQLLQQDKVFPSSAQLIYFYFYLENSHYLFLLLALSHFSVFGKNNASSENGATIQNIVPWYVFDSTQDFPISLIMFRNYTLNCVSSFDDTFPTKLLASAVQESLLFALHSLFRA